MAYLRTHPQAALAQVNEASADERLSVYERLLQSHRKAVQDKRIKQMLEIKTFQQIYTMWKRLGYPFGSLVSSYETVIGASTSRLALLAELMDILENGGIHLPSIHIDRLRFAVDTPYKVILCRDPDAGECVLPPEVSPLVKSTLAGVVGGGAAKRISGTFIDKNGKPIAIGGKTGTGDDRFKTFSYDDGLIFERVVSRSGAFVFYLVGRCFGTTVAYVAGADAAKYKFTSALTAQVLKVLAPMLMNHLDLRDEASAFNYEMPQTMAPEQKLD